MTLGNMRKQGVQHLIAAGGRPGGRVSPAAGGVGASEAITEWRCASEAIPAARESSGWLVAETCTRPSDASPF
jgi:hypothetical protein